MVGRRAGFRERIKSLLIMSVWVKLKVTVKVRAIACALRRNRELLLIESG